MRNTFGLLSYREIEQGVVESHHVNRKTIAFLPVGCTEQHGPYLPIETDTIIATAVSTGLSDALCPDYWSYVFPSISYTPTKSNIHYTGTVSIGEDQFRQYVKQVCKSLLHTEFDAVVFVCGHGPADPSLIEISFNLVHEQYEKKAPKIKPVFMVSLSECRPLLERVLGQKPGRHADWRELLYLVYILGDDYFNQSKVRDIVQFQESNLFPTEDPPVFGIPAELRSVQGVMGDPAPASKEDWSSLAKIAWDATLAHLVDLLRQRLETFFGMEGFHAKE
ncbi:MAG: creatininase family protein [Desulfobacteraceae bacterium]|nr:MAG: creatininase family protein [Desulfobacteraceae bacterium]